MISNSIKMLGKLNVRILFWLSYEMTCLRITIHNTISVVFIKVNMDTLELVNIFIEFIRPGLEMIKEGRY